MIKIVKDSNPKIREKSVEVPLPLSKEDAEFIEEMMKYLKLSQDPEYREKHPACREGVGLAAPQAGRNGFPSTVKGSFWESSGFPWGCWRVTWGQR
jgi:peptide deformylase